MIRLMHLLMHNMYNIIQLVHGTWQERLSWPANFPCRALDVQLMGDHLWG